MGATNLIAFLESLVWVPITSTHSKIFTEIPGNIYVDTLQNARNSIL